MDGSILFTRWCQCAPPSNTQFPRHTPLSIRNSIWMGLAVFAQLTAESPYNLQWTASFPRNCHFAWGIWTPYLTHGSLGPSESITQTASRSVQPFLQGSRSWQTDHNTPSVTIGHIYVVLRCGLIITVTLITTVMTIMITIKDRQSYMPRGNRGTHGHTVTAVDRIFK